MRGRYAPHLLALLRAQVGDQAVELFNFGTNGFDARQIA